MTLPEQMRNLSVAIARAVQGAIPPLFRGVVRIVIDNGVVREHHVSVEYRSPQPKAGHTIQ